jgi:hypothetical protein
MHAPKPEPKPPVDCEVVQFGSEEELRAWARENVADWEQFVENTLAADRELLAWRAAGNPGFPPGSISHREYMRQRGV